jgi:hypothetical protein
MPVSSVRSLRKRSARILPNRSHISVWNSTIHSWWIESNLHSGRHPATAVLSGRVLHVDRMEPVCLSVPMGMDSEMIIRKNGMDENRKKSRDDPFSKQKTLIGDDPDLHSGKLRVTRRSPSTDSRRSPLHSLSYLTRNGKRECTPFALYRFHPDPAAVTFDDPSADRKTDPGSRILLTGMETLEYIEYLLGIQRVDPDAVVPDREDPFIILPFRSD